MAAITTAILACVQTGDHILISDSVYFPTRTFCNSLQRFGIEVEYYDPCIGRDIGKIFRQNTKLVFMESPGSITFEVQDVSAICQLCQTKKIMTIIDNTWATPLFFKPLTLGVDIVIHSATKYITGHSDSLLGVIICNQALYGIVRKTAIQLGQCASGEDAYFGLRGIRTLAVRLQQHQSRALALAEWLETRPEVAEVLYPPLLQHPDHALWKRDFSGATGLFSVVLQKFYNKTAVYAMVNSLQLFGLGHSWGGFESLLVPTDPASYRATGNWKERGMLLRIHVGLENIDDLKSDLFQSFQRLSM